MIDALRRTVGCTVAHSGLHLSWQKLLIFTKYINAPLIYRKPAIKDSEKKADPANRWLPLHFQLSFKYRVLQRYRLR